MFCHRCEWLRYGIATYPRYSLQYDNKGLRLKSAEVDPDHAKFIQHAYWPRPVAMGVWTFAKEVYADTAPRIAKALGLNLTLGSQPTDPIRRALGGPAPVPTTTKTMQHKATKQPEKVNEAGSMASSTDQSAAAASSGASDNKAPSTPDDELSPEDVERIRVAQKAILNSFNAYRKEWVATLDDPPRGGAYISGYVELNAPKAFLQFRISAWYDPKHHWIDPNTFRVIWRRARPKKLA